MEQPEKIKDKYRESSSSEKNADIINIRRKYYVEGKWNPSTLFGFTLNKRILNMKTVNMKMGQEIDGLVTRLTHLAEV